MKQCQKGGTYSHVGVEVALVIIVDSASVRRPRRLEDKNTLDSIAFQFLTRNGITNGRLNTEEEDSRGAGLCLDSTREQFDDDRPSLRLPVSVQHQWTSLNLYDSREGIHNRALPLTDVFVVPIPHLWVNEIAHAAKDAQARGSRRGERQGVAEDEWWWVQIKIE